MLLKVCVGCGAEFEFHPRHPLFCPECRIPEKEPPTCVRCGKQSWAGVEGYWNPRFGDGPGLMCIPCKGDWVDEKWAELGRRACNTCGGRGRVTTLRGEDRWRSIRDRYHLPNCPDCDGVGSFPLEEVSDEPG